MSALARLGLGARCTDELYPPPARGQEFFVHPLDLSYPIAGTINGAKRTACLNTYQYLTLDPEDFTGFDLILGDAFLRNVYAS